MIDKLKLIDFLDHPGNNFCSILECTARMSYATIGLHTHDEENLIVVAHGNELEAYSLKNDASLVLDD